MTRVGEQARELLHRRRRVEAAARRRAGASVTRTILVRSAVTRGANYSRRVHPSGPDAVPRHRGTLAPIPCRHDGAVLPARLRRACGRGVRRSTPPPRSCGSIPSTAGRKAPACCAHPRRHALAAPRLDPAGPPRARSRGSGRTARASPRRAGPRPAVRARSGRARHHRHRARAHAARSTPRAVDTGCPLDAARSRSRAAQVTARLDRGRRVRATCSTPARPLLTRAFEARAAATRRAS